MKKIPLYLKLIPCFFLFLILASIISGETTFDFSEIIAYVILIISVFSFGLYMVFSMENRRDRMNTIKNALRSQDAKIFNIYQLSKYFNPSVVRKIRESLDCYLVSQIDWNLEDIENTSRELSALFDLIRKIKPASEEQKMAKEKIIDNLLEISNLLKEITFQVKNRMSGYEWTSLLVLFSIILFSLFHENVGSFISILIISIVSTAIVLSLLILRELDNLQWQEQKWIWEPLARLFIDIDLYPYFPAVLFSQNRMSIEKTYPYQKIRIAHYKYPYPDNRGKKIEVRTFQK